MEANLRGANLYQADLFSADLHLADLRETELTGACFNQANLHRADLSDATLIETAFRHASLREARMAGALFHDTLLINTDLSLALGLADCRHRGPSSLDHRTITKSESLSATFLRGCGLLDRLIDLFSDGNPAFFSCFISYSTSDQEFAEPVIWGFTR